MSATRRGSAPSWWNLVALALLCTVVFAVTPARAQDPPNLPLTFFKNYFITGDYTVRGVSLWRKGVNGVATANIPAMPEIPSQTDIVAAFLYIQTAESVNGSGVNNATFNGFNLGPWTDPNYIDPGTGVPVVGGGTYAKQLVSWSNAPTPCWSVNLPGGGRKLMTYRADVLRFLTVNATTGKYDFSKAIPVTVPDAGKLFGDDDESCKETLKSSLPRALGASLLIVYRDPTRPLSAVVIYDGAYTKRATATMTQTINGFYEATKTDAAGKPVAPSVKMTHIVGDGRLLFTEQVLFGPSLNRDPYRSSDGPKWDDWTYTNNSAAFFSDARSAIVTVRPGIGIPDCVTFSAMVFRTTVQDADGDGLLDVWETENPPLRDPLGNELPNLYLMGARPDHKDLFVEVNYMDAEQGTQYGGVAEAAHSHLPTLPALTMAAEAFRKAPVVNPDRQSGINLHFDVGDHYQAAAVAPFFTIIPSSLAKGGNSTIETWACPPSGATTDHPDETWDCLKFNGDGTVTQRDLPGQYPKYPGTVGWKTGFQMMRDAIIGRPDPNPANPTGWLAFDYARKDIFHYAFFAHSVGMPVDECLNADGTSDFTCQDDPVHHPDFHKPRTNSGIADLAGGDVLITLGAFRNELGYPVGTDFWQGSTLMHELGHNFWLRHYGPASLNPNPALREPNCKPNYHSVMNYLYQLRGLPDAAGKLQMDYSGEVLGPVSEKPGADSALSAITGNVHFRSGWYAPLAGSYLNGVAKAATKHCDGTPIVSGETPMVRVDAPGVGGDIDWNADGQFDVGYFQDINFDGTIADLNAGANDWTNVRLIELGGRRNVGGYYYIPPDRWEVGPMSLDVGRGDIGRGDIGRGDIGRGDIGRGDIGRGDIGRGDIGAVIGRGDIGRGDIGRGDIGRGDIGRGDIGTAYAGRGDIGRGDIGRGDIGQGDLDVGSLVELTDTVGDIDLETAIAVTGSRPTDPPNSPANELTACLTPALGGDCTGAGTIVRLDWQAPHLGAPVSYAIYRFPVDPAAVFPPASLPATPIATVFGGDGLPPGTSYFDSTAPSGSSLAYFVIANYGGWISSGISNFAIVPTGGTPPAVILTNIVPATAAAGHGQMITVFTSGAPTGTPTATFTQPNAAPAQGFVFPIASQQNAYFIRLPFPGAGAPYDGTLSPGPATLNLVFGGATTQAYPLTVSTTPGAPRARFALLLDDQPGTGPCTGSLVSTTPITRITPGQCIAISAYGIDTEGARAVFTQASASEVQSSLVFDVTGIAAVFRTPATLTPGTVSVQIGTRIRETGAQSPLSNGLSLDVAVGAAASVSGHMYYSAGGVQSATVRLHPGTPATPAQLITTTNADGNYTFPSVPGGTYYPSWEAPAGENYLAGEWVDGTPIVVAGAPVTWNADIPQVMTLVSPASGATTDCGPVLSWTANPDATVYYVQVNVTNGWQLVGNYQVTGQATTTFPLSSLTPQTNYTWQVKAYSAAHLVGETQVPFTFTTGACGVVSGPDLSILGVTHYPSPAPTTADLITITATVANMGNSDAPASQVEVCVGTETPGPSGTCAHLPVPALTVGSTFDARREATLGAAGPYTVAATADYLNAVAETNEGNNTASDSFTVVLAQGITVSGMAEYAGTPVPGTTVELVIDPIDWASLPIRRAVVGADGLYSFSLVPPGTYDLKRWGPADQGYFNWVSTPLVVSADDTGINAPVDVVKVITLLSPANAPSQNDPPVSTCLPMLQWTAILEAQGLSGNRVQINDMTSGQLVTHTGNISSSNGVTTYQLTTSLAPGHTYLWGVDAYDPADHWLGSTYTRFTFRTPSICIF